MSDSSVQTTKRCSKCREDKPATADVFPRNRAKPGGFGNWCKACFNSIAASKRTRRCVPTTDERFWAKVDKCGPVPAHRPDLGECWVWTGGRFSHGYGAFHVPEPRDNNIGAHAYALLRSLDLAELPAGSHACHHCDNPLCVRASHLFLGTPLANMQDKVAKGRQARGERGGMAKFTAAQVLDAVRLARQRVPHVEIAARTGMTVRALQHALYGHTWRHVTLFGDAGDTPPEALVQADDGTPPERL